MPSTNDLQLPPSEEPSEIGAWKKNAAEKVRGAVLQFPSGVSARVKVPGMQEFIALGLIPNSLLGIITSSMEQGKQTVSDGDMMSKITTDPQMLSDMMTLMDNVATQCFLEPLVHPIPTDPNERDEDLLYVDEVELEDKMFLFNVAVGGTKSLAKFRKQKEGRMEGIQSQSNRPKQTKRTGGATKRKS